MRTERNSANVLRVNYERIRDLEKQVEAEVQKLGRIQGGGTPTGDKEAFRIEARIAKLNQKINNEQAKSVNSGK